MFWFIEVHIQPHALMLMNKCFFLFNINGSDFRFKDNYLQLKNIQCRTYQEYNGKGSITGKYDDLPGKKRK